MSSKMSGVEDRRINIACCLLIVLAVLTNFSAINLTFFTDDPALYGSIAKQLIYKHEFLQLSSYGNDWLDKPHLPFWLIFFSFKLFGISNWSYRLPALICFLGSLAYTYLFTKRFYPILVALMAVLIVSTSLHIIMSNADVRAEPFLMCFIIGAIFHLARLENKFTLPDLILAALLTAFSIMTKGIFLIVPIYGALIGQLLLTKKLSGLFKSRWLILFLINLLFITPEIYALYLQFDLHPQKLVFNRHHVSGLKWFFWDSQFGRFFNGGPIRRSSGNIFFFTHTLLWAYAPWCILFFYAIFKNIQSLIKGVKLNEYYTLSGGLITLLLFSVSGFQLPFYTNILFPLFSIITANSIYTQFAGISGKKFTLTALCTYIIAFPVLIIIIDHFLQPANNGCFIAALIVLGVCCVLIIMIDLIIIQKAFILSCIVMVFTGFFLNFFLQPIIVAYKAEPKAADFVNRRITGTQQIYSLSSSNNGFQFYCNRPVKLADPGEFDNGSIDGNSIFYATQDQIDLLTRKNHPLTVVQSFWNYPHESILPAFINFKTRNSTLQRVYLIRQTGNRRFIK